MSRPHIIEQHLPLIMAMAKQRAHENQDIWDLFQETCLIALQRHHKARLDKYKVFLGWASKAAATRLYAVKYKTVDLEHAPTRVSPPRRPEKINLSNLRPVEKQVVNEWKSGWSITDIAKRRKLSRQRISKHFNNALGKLRVELGSNQ